MGIQVQGAGGSIAGVGSEVAEGLHVLAKPADYATFGHYRFSKVTGTLAATLAASAVVFAARWGDSTRFAVITSFKTRFMPLTPFTAATLTDHTSFDTYIGRAYTANHTGGATLTLTGDNNAMRASMGTTLFTEIRIATTAALGGGTVTLDAQPFAQSLRKGNRVNPTATTEEIIMPTTDGMDVDFKVDAGEHPLVLSQDEGIVVTNRTVWPAAGTGILMVSMAWAEVGAY